MAGHSALPNIHVEHNELPNQPFFSWLRTQTTLFISQIVGIFGFIYFLASLIYYAGNAAHSVPPELFINSQNITLFVDYAHVLFLAVFIIALIRVLDDNDRGTYRVGRVYERVFNKKLVDLSKHESLLKKSKDQLQDFKRYFLFFWCAMLFLYISFAFQHGIEQKGHQSHASEKRIDVSKDPIPGVVNIAIVNDAHTKDTNEGAAQHQSDSGTNATTPDEHSTPDLGELHRFLPFFNFLLNNLGLLFVFWCFVVLYVPSRDEESRKRRKSILMKSSSIVVVLLTISFPLLLVLIKGTEFTKDDQVEFSTGFFALSGALFAVALALLIARLDSKLVGLPSRLICVLYLYSAVQPFFAIFEQPGDTFRLILTYVLIIVFIFKIYFFLIIVYTLQTGRMLNYLFCFPFLSEQVNLALDKSPRPKRLLSWRRTVRFSNEKLLQIRQLSRRPIDRTYAKRLFPIRQLFSRLRRSLSWRGAVQFANKIEIRQSFARISGQFRNKRLWPPRQLFLRLSGHIASLSSWLRKQASSFSSWLTHKFYYSWLKKETWLFKFWILCLILLLAFLVAKLRGAPTNFEPYLFYAHIPLLALIVVIIRILINNDQGSVEAYETVFGENRSELKPKSIKTGKSQLRQFKRYFLGFWCAILLLYLTFAIQKQFPDGGPFHIPTISSQAQDKDKGQDKDSARSTISGGGTTSKDSLSLTEALNRLFFPFLTFALSNVNVLYVFWCFVVLYLPSHDRKSRRHKLLRNYSFFIVALFTLSFLLMLFVIERNGFSVPHLDGYSLVFQALSGTLSAVGLALLIARLDSKLIGIPVPIVSVLYFYAALQPFFVVFDLQIAVFKAIKIAVLILVFILKIYFFSIVVYIVQTGRMLNYLVCFPSLNQRVNSIFDNQFEIKTHKEQDHSYSFSITKKNVLVYFTDMSFRRREDCDQAVAELRTLMKDSSAYSPPHEIGGTYWFKVGTSDKNPICESIGLRSEGEVQGLIAESIEQIPYCKYNRS